MNSITECLAKLQELTTKNFEILKALNDSFYTKKNHIVANIDNTNYVIPSFLYLENKIDSLQADFENLVDAPKTGEAVTFFDGTTQKMQLLGYSVFPNRLTLAPVTEFETKKNTIFRDFMTPTPYLKVDVSSISNMVKNIAIRKVCIKNDDLSNRVRAISTNNNILYSDLSKVLFLYEKDVDYIEYDTTQRLPYRKPTTFGTYTIHAIDADWNDANFVEHYTLQLDQDLMYYGDDETIQYDLLPGDMLVTNNNKVQLKITDVHPLSKTIGVEVMYGGYADLATTDSNNTDLYTLKLYQSVNYNDIKYAEVPLEEDRYVCIFVAPIDDTLNAQASWGTGLYLDVDDLRMEDGTPFRTYYNENVNNIGDTLYDITQMLNSSLTNLTEPEWNNVITNKPVILSDNISVTQINKHLNDSDTVKTIRSLYDEKNTYKSELDTIQKSIDEITSTLSELSFDDTTNNRTLYTSQLQDLKSQKIDITNSIYSISQNIASAANSADVPIENAKYHIRGFVDAPSMTVGDVTTSVIKIDVEYRYKNKNKFTGNAESIGEEGYIYSDWNKMESFYNRKHPHIQPNGTYKFLYDADNSNINEPSFNQLDIPISQGESVDVRVRYVYDLGFPFVETLSDWSDVLNIPFPDEYVQDVDVLQIIDENNDDIKNNYFSSVLNKTGIVQHVDDKIEDQNLTYFHSPEHIASGFYTNERRIIPLSTKLSDMITEINNLKAEVLGQQSNNLQIYLTDNENSLQMQPNILNEFRVSAYMNNPDKLTEMGSIADVFGTAVAYKQLNLNLYNVGQYDMKIYTMFPGDPNTNLTRNIPSKYNAEDYIFLQPAYNGVWMETDYGTGMTLQSCNQLMYFRVNDIFNGTDYYKTGVINLNDPKMPATQGVITSKLDENNYTQYFNQFVQPTSTTFSYASLYPYIGQKSVICMNADSNYITIKPGESLSIPLSFYYAFIIPAGTVTATAMSVSKTIAFDIRNSLYQNPLTYRLKVSANYNDIVSFKVKKYNDTLTVGDASIDVVYSPTINKTQRVTTSSVSNS